VGVVYSLTGVPLPLLYQCQSQCPTHQANPTSNAQHKTATNPTQPNPNPNQTKPNQTKPNHTTPHHTTPHHTTPHHTTPQNQQPNHTTPHNPKTNATTTPHRKPNKLALWARRLPDGVAYPPGMVVDGQGQVSSVYDYADGTYQVV